MAISFSVSTPDAEIIASIVRRAEALAIQHGGSVDRMSLTMDMMACHANGTPLRLADLLAADDFNFSHDVFGIRRHIDRDDSSPTAGQMLDCFLPRFYDSKAAKAAEDDVDESTPRFMGADFDAPAY